MGLNSPTARLMCAAKSLGADFTDFVMIGRQSLSADPETMQRVLATLGVHAEPRNYTQDGYSERFIALFGAKNIHSVDFSAFEGATDLHDMNLPIGEEYRGKYSFLLDGGSLEHVFNFPQAVKNCMEMVRVGGHILMVNPSNNWLGHGFWQFGPELAFRVFDRPNGFDVIGVFLQETDGRCYRVADPAVLHRRVTIDGGRPLMLMTLAKRVADVPIFETAPQQSDYASVWKGETRAKRASRSTIKVAASAVLHALGLGEYIARRRIRLPSSDHAAFKIVAADDLMRGRF